MGDKIKDGVNKASEVLDKMTKNPDLVGEKKAKEKMEKNEKK